ncbi:MAG: hypothetical protein QXP49_06000 [Nitrososphaerota archaeon]
MAITLEDIKLMKSEVMADTPDGGGRMTGLEVVDGQSNNIFPDVSELDRVYGRIQLRKIFAAVLSDNTDTYYGANAIISEPPQDQNINVTLLRISTQDAWYNTRSTAKDKLEAYLTKGPLAPFRLVGDHWEGQRVLLVYQGVRDQLPRPGEVYVLVYGAIEQYVRVLKVDAREVDYYDDKGTFTRMELALTISDALRYNFPYGRLSRDYNYTPPTLIYRTNTVEAVNCYGIAKLTQAAGFNTNKIKVDTYKAALVPSTQTESVVLDARIGAKKVTVTGGARSAEVPQTSYSFPYNITTQNRQYNYVFQLPMRPHPGSVVVWYRSRGSWYQITDNGSGGMTGDGAGSINYLTGSLSVTVKDLPDIDSKIIVEFGTDVEYETVTAASVVPPAWRYTLSNPPVKPGSVTITWTAGGQTKTATDSDGNGVLQGDGVGYIIYSTGELYLKPSTLPDSSASPLVQYSRYLSTNVEAFEDVPIIGGLVTVTLQNQPMSPVRVACSYKAHVLFYEFKPGLIMVPSYYDPHEPPMYYVFPGTHRTPKNHELTINFANNTSSPNRSEHHSTIFLQVTTGSDGSLPLGEIDYINKTVTIPVSGVPYLKSIPVYETQEYCNENGCWVNTYYSGYVWSSDTSYITVDENAKASVVVSYVTGSDAETYSENIPSQSLVIDLTPMSDKQVVPGTVQFKIGNDVYTDFDGKIYKNNSIEAGIINYETGRVTVTSWQGGGSFELQSCAVSTINRASSSVSFIVPSRVKPSSFTISAVATDGTQIYATCDSAGNITGDFVEGFINLEMGDVSISFGEWVLDSSLSNEEKQEKWYNSRNVRPDGYIWRPKAVFVDTVRYNAVTYVYMPLNADILGLDPVRLPVDGKVPIFRVGDVVVVHATRNLTVNNPYSNQTVNLGVTRLSYVRLYDANNNVISADKYTVDLDAGTVTFVDIQDVTAPVRIEYRFEDASLVSDLQIDGTLQLTRALTHSYSVGDYVSSALVIGDMWARVSVFP